MNKVYFNEARALEVLPILAALWKRREGVFKGEKLPQELWTIRGDDRMQAHWFFYIAHTMRGGLVSEDPFKWLFHVREKFGDIFEPKKVARKWKPEKLKNAFLSATKEIMPWPSQRETKGVGTLGYKLDELVEHWHYNSGILARHWDGNILNVFDGVSNFEDVFERIERERAVLLPPGTSKECA